MIGIAAHPHKKIGSCSRDDGPSLHCGRIGWFLWYQPHRRNASAYYAESEQGPLASNCCPAIFAQKERRPMQASASLELGMALPGSDHQDQHSRTGNICQAIQKKSAEQVDTGNENEYDIHMNENRKRFSTAAIPVSMPCLR